MLCLHRHVMSGSKETGLYEAETMYGRMVTGRRLDADIAGPMDTGNTNVADMYGFQADGNVQEEDTSANRMFPVSECGLNIGLLI
jgi:hypothetical protein